MNKKMRITVISLLSVVFAVSVGFLVKDYCDSKMQAELYDIVSGAMPTEHILTMIWTI